MNLDMKKKWEKNYGICRVIIADLKQKFSTISFKFYESFGMDIDLCYSFGGKRRCLALVKDNKLIRNKAMVRDIVMKEIRGK